MKGIIKKWGNSFAIRIPKVIMDDAHLKTDSEIDITITDGKILMSPTLPSGNYFSFFNCPDLQ